MDCLNKFICLYYILHSLQPIDVLNIFYNVRIKISKIFLGKNIFMHVGP